MSDFATFQNKLTSLSNEDNKQTHNNLFAPPPTQLGNRLGVLNTESASEHLLAVTLIDSGPMTFIINKLEFANRSNDSHTLFK